MTTQQQQPHSIMFGGRYTLKRILHHSSLNRVYLAHDQQTGLRVVLKHVARDCTSFEQHVPACYNLAYESSMLDVLRRYGIRAPRSHGFSHIDGHACLVMQYLPGQTLDALAQTSTLNLVAVVTLIDDLAAILQRVHALGYAHQDVKPHNVMVLPSGRALLIDWGAAARVRPADEYSPFVAWTEGFASWEQMRGQILATNDIYALGKTLHRICPNPSPLLQPIIERATAQLSRRYQSMAELRADLSYLLWPRSRVMRSHYNGCTCIA